MYTQQVLNVLFQKDTEEKITVIKGDFEMWSSSGSHGLHSTGWRREVIRILAGTGLEHVRHDVDIVVARQLAWLRVKPQLVSNTDNRIQM